MRAGHWNRSTAWGWILSLAVLVGCQHAWKPTWSPFRKPEVGPKVASPAERMEQLRELAQQAATMPAAQAEQISQQMLVEIQKEDDPLMRIAILQALAAMPTATASAVMQAAMSDPDRDVRCALCTAWRTQSCTAPRRPKPPPSSSL